MELILRSVLFAAWRSPRPLIKTASKSDEIHLCAYMRKAMHAQCIVENSSEKKIKSRYDIFKEQFLEKKVFKKV